MAKTYWFTFSTQDPRTYTGLAPTFVQFVNQIGQTLAPPGVTESPAGFGFYRANYTVGASTSVAFLLDGGATLAASVRYISGNIFGTENLDYLGATVIQIGTNVTNIGTTQIAIGSTVSAIGPGLTAIGSAIGTTSNVSGLIALIGAPSDSYGSTSVDPTTLFGYVKRAQEFQEGNQGFLKSTGFWSVFSRGSSTLLTTKTLSSDLVGVTRI